jgi:hypothetical protein
MTLQAAKARLDIQRSSLTLVDEAHDAITADGIS